MGWTYGVMGETQITASRVTPPPPPLKVNWSLPKRHIQCLFYMSHLNFSQVFFLPMNKVVQAPALITLIKSLSSRSREESAQQIINLHIPRLNHQFKGWNWLGAPGYTPGQPNHVCGQWAGNRSGVFNQVKFGWTDILPLPGDCYIIAQIIIVHKSVYFYKTCYKYIFNNNGE